MTVETASARELVKRKKEKGKFIERQGSKDTEGGF